MMRIPEGDWKKLRRIREELLRRLRAGILYRQVLRDGVAISERSSGYGYRV